MSLDKLIEGIVKKQNPSVVGLDTKLEYVPEFIKKKAFEKYGETLKGAAKAILEFNKGIIDEIYGVIPAIKPQAAYYEMYGYAGMKTLRKTQEYARQRGLYVITDGKRNDIGPTMEAYAAAHLGNVMVGKTEISPFVADALTVNGFLGSDGILPAVEVCEKFDKGIFVLVKTSNPSSGELQDKVLSDKINSDMTVYEVMGKMCEEIGARLPGKYGYTGVGAVIGATYPEMLKEMRVKLPNTFFLVPAYGAQGGKAEDLKGAFDKNGLGAVVNNSRGVICAYKKEGCDERDYAGAALREVNRMKKAITNVTGEIKLP